MKNSICLKGVCLKVSETLKTKKIEKAICQMHTSASVQTQSPAPKAVKHNFQEERKIIYLFNHLSMYRKQEWKGLQGNFSWLKYVLLFLTITQPNSFPHVFYKSFPTWL